MNLFFWKKDHFHARSIRPDWNHHSFRIERDGESEKMSAHQLEKAFGITYHPQLEFPSWKDYEAISRQVQKYRKKNFLDHQQLWLGTYFQKEIISPILPSVYLRWIDEKLGWGIFAERDLKPMEFIGEYAGIVRRKQRVDSKNSYCFQYAIVCDETTKYTIDAQNQGGIVRFINHSDSPNLMSALATHQDLCHVVLFVSRPIKKGEQISYNYGPDYWSKRSKPSSL